MLETKPSRAITIQKLKGYTFFKKKSNKNESRSGQNTCPRNARVKSLPLVVI